MKIGYVIGIDGPSGSGKSSVAKRLARKLKIRYIDTGAMYRAAALAATRQRVDLDDEAEVERFLAGLLIVQEMAGEGVATKLGEEDVSEAIRAEEMGMAASKISALPPVRRRLTALQQQMGQEGGVVMEGRDVCTVVFPNADFKFFLTASDTERATRRQSELIEKGQEVDFETVLSDIRKRDHNDSTRKVAPLRRDEQALEIDSTGMALEEVVDELLGMIEASGPGKKQGR